MNALKAQKGFWSLGQPREACLKPSSSTETIPPLRIALSKGTFRLFEIEPPEYIIGKIYCDYGQHWIKERYLYFRGTDEKGNVYSICKKHGEELKKKLGWSLSHLQYKPLSGTKTKYPTPEEAVNRFLRGITYG